MAELEEWEFYDSEDDVAFFTAQYFAEKELRYIRSLRLPNPSVNRVKHVFKGPAEPDSHYPLYEKKPLQRVVYGTEVKMKKSHKKMTPSNSRPEAVESIPTYKHWTLISRNILEEDDTVLRFHPYLDVDDAKNFEEDYLEIFERRALVTTDWDADTIALRVIASRLNELQGDSDALSLHSLRSLCQYVTKFKNPMSKKELIEAATQSDDYKFNEETYDFFVDMAERCSREPAELMQLWLERGTEVNEAEDDTIAGEELCSWCAKYSCVVHAGRPDVGGHTEVHSGSKEEDDCVLKIPCSPNCFLSQDNMPPKDLETEREFTPAEAQLLIDAREIFGNNVCQLANFIGGNITCLEVWNKLGQPRIVQPGEPSVPVRESPEATIEDVGFTSGSESDSCYSEIQEAPKSRPKRTSHNSIAHQMHDHQACYHPGEICGATCPCRHPALHHDCNLNPQKGPVCECRDQPVYCEKDCLCDPNCPYRYPGCVCENLCDTTRCRCYREGRECDPDLCGKRQSKGDKHIARCRNLGMLTGSHRHTKIGKSQVSGWGLFIMEKVRRHDFIGEYLGEVISWDEAERRGAFYDRGRNINYLFELNLDYQVDATRKGSKLRFINHSERDPNCYPVVRLVNGEHRIGFYASRDLKPGEELFFDYGDHGKSVKFVAVERPTKK